MRLYLQNDCSYTILKTVQKSIFPEITHRQIEYFVWKRSFYQNNPFIFGKTQVLIVLFIRSIILKKAQFSAQKSCEDGKICKTF